LAGSAKADAATIDLLTINSTEQAMEQILAASDTVLAGATLATEPVTPQIIEHKIAENETLSDIAKKYDTTWKRIYDKNESIVSPDIISPGEIIIIPSAEEELSPRDLPEPIVQEPILDETKSNPAQTKKSSAPISVAGNKYVAGYCTWYVKNRRPDLPNNLGNAISWVSRAAAQGLATGSTPRVGAAGQQGNHVVYVESVNGDGTVTISDMNFSGWNVVTTRTVPASNFSYIY
jgi:surface antigen